MARIRFIKPETFDDPDMGMLPIVARWVFVGLWTQADRSGRVEDDPRRLKVRLLPFDARVNMDAVLDQLAPRFITRYTVNGRNYLQVNNFTKHQHPHPKEAESGYPGPDDPEAVKRNGQPRKYSASKPDSGVLSLESGVLNTDRDRRRLSPDVDPRFETFWRAYPNKKAKAAARRTWEGLHVDDGLLATMLAAIETQRTWRTWREGFIPHPATWLNQQRWLDEPEPARENPKSRTAGNADALRVALERRRAT